MELIRGLHNLRQKHKSCVATIGNFDGMHPGHLDILRQVKNHGRIHNLPSVVIIFEPQPLEYLLAEQAPERLSSLREKLRLLTEQDIDRVLCLTFNQQLKSLSAQDFIDILLVEKLAIECFIIGDDFRFGHDRCGDFNLLQKVGQQQGFKVIRSPTYCIDGERVSSTRIRKALQKHNFALIKKLSGRPFTISGKVIRGQQLGQHMGIPTANIKLAGSRSVLQGVFATRVHGLAAQPLTSISNIGYRPTISTTSQAQLEVHLFDFNDNLYGKVIQVEFCKYIRPERYFSNIDLLRQQIDEDINQAKAYFNNI